MVEYVSNRVKESFAEADVGIQDTVSDRAHRIGPAYNDESYQNLLLNGKTLDIDQCPTKIRKN